MKFDITIRDLDASELEAIIKISKNSGYGKMAAGNEIIKVGDFSPASELVRLNTMDGTEFTSAPVLTNDGAHTAPQVAAPSVDSSGLPWDARIHSSNRECNKDGTWRRKRGVAEMLVDQVEAELRGVKIDAPAAPQLPNVQTIPAPTAAPFVPAIPQIPNAGIPPMQPQAVAPVQHIEPPAESLTRTFEAVLKRIQNGFAAKKIDSAGVKQLTDYLSQVSGLQVTNPTDIGQSPALIEKAHEALDTWGL